MSCKPPPPFFFGGGLGPENLRLSVYETSNHVNDTSCLSSTEILSWPVASIGWVCVRQVRDPSIEAWRPTSSPLMSVSSLVFVGTLQCRVQSGKAKRSWWSTKFLLFRSPTEVVTYPFFFWLCCQAYCLGRWLLSRRDWRSSPTRPRLISGCNANLTAKNPQQQRLPKKKKKPSIIPNAGSYT